MVWHSTLKSASEFIKAVHKDPDLVFLTHADRRLALTVSGAAELAPSMTIVGPDGKWRVCINTEGRRLIAVQIRIVRQQGRRLARATKSTNKFNREMNVSITS